MPSAAVVSDPLAIEGDPAGEPVADAASDGETGAEVEVPPPEAHAAMVMTTARTAVDRTDHRFRAACIAHPLGRVVHVRAADGLAVDHPPGVRGPHDLVGQT